MAKAVQKEKDIEESITMFWMRMENLESFDDVAVFTIEILA